MRDRPALGSSDTAAEGLSRGIQSDMKILLAEDSSVTRVLFEAIITEAGHNVTSVEDGHAAWDSFERERPPLVIIDWMMPGLDGIQLCRRIRASDGGQDTFVLLLTGRGTSEDVESALDAGVDDFVAKPVSTEVLRARVCIAERRIHQNAVRRATEEALARARWLAGIGEATLTMQHEINNPLAALIAEAELLASDLETLNSQRPHLASIGVQARRIADVVRRLSRLEDPRSVEYIEGVRMLDLFGKES